jgi:hypothetical protein
LPAISPEGLTRQEAVRRARCALSLRLGLTLDDDIPETLRAARGR